MSTILSFGRDSQGYNAYAPAPATDLFSVSLTAGSNTSFTVPSNYKIWNVTFSYAGASDIWVAYGSTATIPLGATLAATKSELNPASRRLNGGTVVSIINNGSATIDVGVACYAVAL